MPTSGQCHRYHEYDISTEPLQPRVLSAQLARLVRRVVTANEAPRQFRAREAARRARIRRRIV